MIIIPIFIDEKIKLKGIKLESRRVSSKPIISKPKDYSFFVIRTWDLGIVLCAEKADT